MRLRVDRNKCAGLGNCVVIAPTVFRLDGASKAVVTDPSSVSDTVLWQAAESCTVDAIILENASGDAVYP
jgi:ferredoxin